MNYLGIEYDIKNVPVLDHEFIPFGVWMKEYLKGADRPIAVAVEREDGLISVRKSAIRGPEFAEANLRYVERLIKFSLWSIGGFKVYVCGCDDIAEQLAHTYSPEGDRWFDYQFVGDVYEKPLEIIAVSEADFPEAHESAKQIGGHMEGCRIGFDAGGSDRKVSAVIDGESVYSEEVVWFPKITEDPEYHFNEIVTAFKTAASKMPRVDAIGVSSAGTFVGNSPMVASLFIKVPRERREEVKSIYDRAGKEIGDVPLVVANDGDVTALAGFMSTGSGDILGIAMGTSEAVGYVNDEGNVLGWINELAFAPVDLSPEAMQDEWSTDFGVGCKYFSQDAVIKLAPRANIELDPELSPAEKLKVVQELANNGDAGALDIYRSIGVYLAHTLVLYSSFYEIKTLMVLGRVASGDGGDLLISECNRVLAEEYPELAAQITVKLPDEKMRRVGQSVAAASLPEL
ncbi:ROK family protein [Adlercreutzia agrestimuris]|uniref:ROK family protein n=1 Tax=Adlercreutzia agrestimuris TaxID=2941324 RepID=UPI002040B862|nr:ROK family protein [Adlercreutzia agrestimuris]